MRIRFVCGSGLESGAIEAFEHTCMPGIPSHVEAVSEDGQFYIGQHIDGGMKRRPVGYDAGTFSLEFFVDLPATPEQNAAFYNYIEASVGEPYDWEAILGFAVPGHFHERFTAICSAKIFLALRDGCDWFPSHAPMAVPAHCIDPRDLLLILSAIVKIEH
jgi:hypothetical protein